jgi:hypothetical protein
MPTPLAYRVFVIREEPNLASTEPCAVYGWEFQEEFITKSIPNQEDHGFYPWVNWSSGTGCSPLVGVSKEPRALPVGLHWL